MIEIVTPHERWALWCETEAAARQAVFGRCSNAGHHLRSTALPRLATNPIINGPVVRNATHGVTRCSPSM